jgi:hypothetical protein
MRNVVASVFVVGLFSLPVAAAQGRSGGSPASPGIKACSLLTKDLAMKVSGGVNKAVFDIPPSEEPAGKSGSACDYADIHLQIDPFSVSFVDATAQKDKTWVPVPGVGDRAWFHNNRDRFAELMVIANGHVLTIQQGVPFESTAEKMKPNVITLGQAIVPKLK